MDGYVQIGTKLDTNDFDAEIKYIESQLDEIEHKLKQADMGFDVGDTVKLESQYSKLVKQLDKLQKKQADLNKTDLSEIQRNIDKVSDSVGKTVTKVGKWALAVFSVRSAYMFVRQSVSTLSQYNEQLATDLEYISYATSSALEPVIENLVALVYKLLSFVNLIAEAWFGVNLFAKASADSFNKGAKSAEKMKKSLAGFDEMNVLNENGGTGAIGSAPSIDLSQSLDPTQVEEMKSFWANIIKFWEEDYSDFFASIGGNWGLFFEGLGVILKGFYDIFKGVFQLIRNVVEIVVGLFQGDFDKIEDAWASMGDGLYNILVGVLNLILGVLAVVIGTIKGLFLEIVGWINKNVIIPIGNFFKSLWNGVVTGFKGAINFITGTFKSVVNFFKNLINTVVGLFKKIGTKVGDAISGAFKSVINAVLKSVETILNKPIKAINDLLDVINTVPGISIGKLNTLKLPRLAVGGIVNMPGKGVPIGGAITGESGAEGVIPLTDAQAMETLGATIGRYITINANITNTMNGRVISRELQKINNSDDFAMNR